MYIIYILIRMPIRISKTYRMYKIYEGCTRRHKAIFNSVILYLSRSFSDILNDIYYKMTLLFYIELHSLCSKFNVIKYNTGFLVLARYRSIPTDKFSMTLLAK